MEEAVFSLRLKCRTRVPLQGRRPTEQRTEGIFCHYGNTQHTFKLYQYSTDILFKILLKTQKYNISCKDLWLIHV